MNLRQSLLWQGFLWFLPAAAEAESLRCEKGTVSEGESRLSVAYKCGQPVISDGRCSTVYYSGSVYTVPEPIAGAYVPCLYIEEWLYERGPGNMVAVVRMRAGKVQSITYGRQPQ